MRLEEAIKRIEERKRLWEEYARRIEKYAWEGGDYPFDIVEKLLGVREEIELISDYFYEHECAWCIASELRRVLDILKQVV
jgi:hypothetical protein